LPLLMAPEALFQAQARAAAVLVDELTFNL
jgi:hypothetical protein